MRPLIRRKWLRLAIAAVVVLGTAAGMFVYESFFRDQPAPYFESDEDHFLFGSVGTEAAQGIPYWIWLVLPRIFPDLLPGPGGYASLGVLSKPGHEMPIGLSKVTIGFPRVGINCAMCHAASVRLRPTDLPTIISAAPSHQTTLPIRDSRRTTSSAKSPGTIACRSANACSTASPSCRPRAAHCCSCASKTGGCTPARNGDAAASTRSIR
jgi:hypothetical protein